MTEVIFRLGYLPGVTPAKWATIWRERWPDRPLELTMLTREESWQALAAGRIDALLGRLPAPDARRLHTISLYEERSVVVVPADHVITAAETVTCSDLDEEVVLAPLDDPLDWLVSVGNRQSNGTEAPASGGAKASAAAINEQSIAAGRPGIAAVERPASTADAVELVAAGAGLLVVPQSLARLHHRKDLTYREVTDAPRSSVGLVWPRFEAHVMIEEMIGIVRGRTVNSTRGSAAAPAAESPAGTKGVGGRSGGSDTGRSGAGRSGQGSSAGGKNARGKFAGGRPANGRSSGGRSAGGKGSNRRGR